MLKGIDVSEHQGYINWNKVKNSGIQFAIIRVGYGRNNIDKQFVNNANGCINVGIPLGLYWFSYAYTIDMARQEARYCISQAKKYKISYPIAYDLEYDTVRYAKKNGANITKDLASRMVVAFCEEVKKAGYKTMNYSNQDYYYNMFNDSINKYDLWYAWYNSNLNRKCGIWQYSESGKINGINTGSVDMNYSYVDYSKDTKEENKVENIVVYNNYVDKRAAEYLGDYLHCPYIAGNNPFDFSQVENVYAVGGGEFTSYVKKHIGKGKDRWGVIIDVLKFCKKI